ncbi:MAG TPA: hypothetical protein VF484_03620, partial [Candidatus Limnocylindrales bacterium]
IVLAAIGGIRLFSSLGAPAASAGASGSAAAAEPTAQPVVMGPLVIGAYAPRSFEPAFTFAVADTGWTANRDVPGLFSLIREGAPRGGLVFARVQEVVTSPCVGGDVAATAPIAGDTITLMQAVPHLQVSDVRPITVAGIAGQQAEITVSEAAQAACGGLAGGDIAILRAGDEDWSASPGERFRVVGVRVADQPVTILMSLDWTATHSVQELEELLQLSQRVVDSVAFVEG